VGVGQQVLGQDEIMQVGRGEMAVNDHPGQHHP
jgi:hypothetical protein